MSRFEKTHEKEGFGFSRLAAAMLCCEEGMFEHALLVVGGWHFGHKANFIPPVNM